jgi:hypothetical protein
VTDLRELTVSTVITGTNNSPAERVAASRCVLRNAKDRDDLRLLLEALGLTSASREGAS